MKHGRIQRRLEVTADLFSVRREEWIKDHGRTWAPAQLKIAYWEDGGISWCAVTQLIRTDGTPGGTRKEFGPSMISEGPAKEALWALVWELQPPGYKAPEVPGTNLAQ